MIDQRNWSEEDFKALDINWVITQREVYSSPKGREVLGNLILNCHLFSEVETEREVSERNFGIRLLEGLGVLNIENIDIIVQMLLSLPLPAVRKEEVEKEY